MTAWIVWVYERDAWRPVSIYFEEYIARRAAEGWKGAACVRRAFVQHNDEQPGD